MQEEKNASDADEIMALERAALDRWYQGDPKGQLELCDTSVTGFDPTTPARVDGYQAMEERILPLTGKILIDHYEILNPKVQLHGDVAIVTFNLVVFVPQDDGTEKALYNWNATEVYARINGNWKIVHSHWSYTKPEDSLI